MTFINWHKKISLIRKINEFVYSEKVDLKAWNLYIFYYPVNSEQFIIKNLLIVLKFIINLINEISKEFIESKFNFSKWKTEFFRKQSS